MVAEIKKWLIPLARTFLAAFLAALASTSWLNLGHISLSTLQQVGFAALAAGFNAVVIAAQHVAPGVPNPQPPVA